MDPTAMRMRNRVRLRSLFWVALCCLKKGLLLESRMVQNSRCRGHLKGFHGNGHDLSADVFFSGSSNPGAVDTEDLHERLDAAVARGVVGAGLAHRAVLAARLTRTLPQAGADACLAAISGEALARTLGLSRAAVHKHVNHLRTLGFAVESLPGAGYRLERPFADLVAAEAVLPFLLGLSRPETPWMAGLPYLYLPRCESTNLSLKEAMAPRGAGALPAGALMVTDEQTGGRGRLGRTWSSEAGKDLTFSVLLRPSLAPAQAHLLSLAAALAVAEVLETLPGLEGRVAVKWPNDVLLGDEKVCGILLEGSMDVDRLHWAVAGIGLNVNSAPSALGGGPGARGRRSLGRAAPAGLFAGAPGPRGASGSAAGRASRAADQPVDRLGGSRRLPASARQPAPAVPAPPASSRRCGSATPWPGARWRSCRDRGGRGSRTWWRPARRSASGRKGSCWCGAPRGRRWRSSPAT